MIALPPADVYVERSEVGLVTSTFYAQDDLEHSETLDDLDDDDLFDDFEDDDDEEEVVFDESEYEELDVGD